MLRLSALLLLSVPLLTACRSAGPAAAESSPAALGEGGLDWTLGAWIGVRRDAASGRENVLRMTVEPILGGAGQLRELEIPHGSGVYRGFCVQVHDPDSGLWNRRYVNDVRRTYAELEGRVEGDRSEWRSTTPGRSRESLLVSERLEEPGRGELWRRTMRVSEDGGETWRDLWVDELGRPDGSRSTGPGGSTD